MLVRRSLVAVALCCAAALTATTGCSAVSARWSDPKPEPTEDLAVGQVDDDPGGSAPPRTHTLTMTAQTLFFLEGVLPNKAADGTTAALAGSLVLRGECQGGSLTVAVTGPAGTKRTPVSCDGRPHERALGEVKVGDVLGVQLSGKAGTDFAIELAAE